MALDHNIIGGIRPIQIESPINMLTQALRVKGMQQESQLGQAKLDEYTRAKTRQNAMQTLVQSLPSTTTEEQRINALKGGGYFDEADKLESGWLNRQKVGAEVKAKEFEAQSKKLDLAGQAFGYVRQNPTLEAAHQALDYLGANGIYTPETVAQYKQAVAADPTKIAALADMAFRTALGAKEQLASIQTRNTGGTTDTVSVDPVTGEAKVVSSVRNTQSPDSIASAAVQMRGQDMADRRAAADRTAADRRFTASQPGAKPLPTAALKMQQSELDALATAGGIDGELARIEGQVSGGKLSFGPVSNLVNRGRNAAGLSTEESRNFASFQSTLEKLRNDSLRLNAGVQTDGDAQRAWNELFANINDVGVVKQRLGEIRNINKRGAQLRKLNIDGIRGNYGHDPLDTARYEQPGAPPGPAPSASAPQKAGLPSGWSVKVK